MMGMGFIHFIRDKKVILIGLTSVLIVIILILYVFIGGGYGIKYIGNKANTVATMPDYPQNEKFIDKSNYGSLAKMTILLLNSQRKS